MHCVANPRTEDYLMKSHYFKLSFAKLMNFNLNVIPFSSRIATLPKTTINLQESLPKEDMKWKDSRLILPNFKKEMQLRQANLLKSTTVSSLKLISLRNKDFKVISFMNRISKNLNLCSKIK